MPGYIKNTRAFLPMIALLAVAFVVCPWLAVRKARREGINPQVIYDSYVPRVVDWYKTASYGRLALQVTPLRRWLSLPHSASYYRGTGNLTADAIDAADPVFDFSGTDALYLVLAGDAGLGDGMVQLLPYTADGASIRAPAWLPTDGPAEGTIPFVTHETGHILGLPDLYVGGRPETFTGLTGLGDLLIATPTGHVTGMGRSPIVCSTSSSSSSASRPGRSHLLMKVITGMLRWRHTT